MVNPKKIEQRPEELLVNLLYQLLEGNVSYFEGAPKIVAIKSQLSEIPDDDEDFSAFMVIYSETDHIPSKEARSLLSNEAMAEYEAELEKTETWARSFAESACRRLLERFESGKQRS